MNAYRVTAETGTDAQSLVRDVTAMTKMAAKAAFFDELADAGITVTGMTAEFIGEV